MSENLLEAEKALSTGWFKRKPDYEMAAQCFDSAGNTFKHQKSFEEACAAYLRAADSHHRCEQYYLSAKSFESAALVQSQNLRRLDRAADLHYQASREYLQDNKSDRAIEQLEKAAKCFDVSPVSISGSQQHAMSAANLDKSLSYYEEALLLSEESERGMLSVDLFKRVIGVYIRLSQLDKAASTAKRLNVVLERVTGANSSAHLLYKNYLTLSIILLKFGDPVEAGKQYEQAVTRVNGFVQSDEGGLAGQLLDGFDKNDQATIDACVKRPQINFLDNEVAKLARQLRVMGGQTQLAADNKFQALPAGFSELTDDLPTSDQSIAGVPKEETSELC